VPLQDITPELHVVQSVQLKVKVSVNPQTFSVAQYDDRLSVNRNDVDVSVDNAVTVIDEGMVVAVVTACKH
jgi:hypothetical protein